MSKRSRRTHAPAFKAKVALARCAAAATIARLSSQRSLGRALLLRFKQPL
jgi:transposase-like protein